MNEQLSFNFWTIIFSIFNLAVVIAWIGLAVYIAIDAYRRKLEPKSVLFWAFGAAALFPLVPIVYFYYRKKGLLQE